MTRQAALGFVLTELGPDFGPIFDRYANDAEAFDGDGFWTSFDSREDFVDDFRLFAADLESCLAQCA